MTTTPPPMDHWFDKWVYKGRDRSIRFQRVFGAAGPNLLEPDNKRPGRMWLRPRYFPTTGELVQFTIDIVGAEMKRGMSGLILSPLGQKEPVLDEKLPVWKDDQWTYDEYARILAPLVKMMDAEYEPDIQRLEALYTIGMGGKIAVDRLRVLYIDDAVVDGSPMTLVVLTHVGGDALVPSQNGGGNGPPDP